MRMSSPWSWVALTGLAVILVLAVLVTGWTLNARHFFYADDWAWLQYSEFRGWEYVLRLFPEKLYNDRPGGEIFVLVVYRLFGLDSHPYNVLWLCLHLINCVLFYLILWKILPASRALLGVLLASCWYSTLIAVHWIGAIFDLAGATWCLATLALYVLPDRNKGNRFFWVAAVIVTHVLAIRTKEFSLALIAVLASWEFLLMEHSGWRDRLWRLAPHTLITLVYACIYFVLYEKSRSFVTGGAYKIAFSVPVILDNLSNYLAQAFYVPPSWGDSANRWVGGSLLCVLLMAGLVSKQVMAGLISALALLAAVLFMPNQRSMLYLYAPHFFLAMAMVAVVPKAKAATAVLLIAIVALVALPFLTFQWKWDRDFYLGQGKYSHRLFDDYIALMHGQEPPSEFTIGVTRPYFDPFSWGAGSAVRVYHHEARLRVKIVKMTGPDDDICAKVSGLCLMEKGVRLVRARTSSE